MAGTAYDITARKLAEQRPARWQAAGRWGSAPAARGCWAARSGYHLQQSARGRFM